MAARRHRRYASPGSALKWETPVTTRPGDDITAGKAGRGHLRASHADRERVIATLKTAYVHGMLTKDEFDLRVGQAIGSRTYADLAALTADLPAMSAATQPPKPALVQPPPPSVTDGKAAARMIATATAIPAGLWAFVFFAPNRYTDNEGVALLVLSSTFVWLIALLLVGVDMHISRQERRSGGQPAQRPAPGAGGQASQGPVSADPGRRLPPADPGPWHNAEAAPGRRPRPPRSPKQHSPESGLIAI